MIAKPESSEPEMHISPDGALALCVTPEVEGETMIGFHGFDWAISATQLSEFEDCDRSSIDAAQLHKSEPVQKYVQTILADEAIIAVSVRGEEITDAWVTEFPQDDLQFCSDDEQLQFRYWSGKAAQV
jgi:hypothetical protein